MKSKIAYSQLNIDSFIKTKPSTTPGQIAILESPPHSNLSKGCIKFAYILTGIGAGSLKIMYD